MKLILIKIGKVWKTIRQEGLCSGGKRTLKYLLLFLKTLFQNPRGDVLFVTTGIGDSARYRAYNQAEELNIHGIQAAVMVLDHPNLPKFADRFKIFVFNRTLVTKKAQLLISEIKKQKKEIIFDTDDLVFDAKFMHQTESYQKMNSLEKKQYEKGIGEEILHDPYVKVCTTTTSFIKNILEGYRKKVFINVNKINLHELEVAEKILKHKTCNIKHETKNNRNNCGMLNASCCMNIRLGYFSGTMSHNKDFATITNALFRIMEKYSQVELVLVGPLAIENELNEFQGRIFQSGLVSLEKHFENIASVDINLAPLEMNNPFCDAKSELKFFEAGIVKVPTVAIKNQTFSQAIEDGVDGFLAGTEDEWFEKLEKLILDENLRHVMGEKACQKTLEKYTTKNANNEEYYSYLRSKIL